MNKNNSRRSYREAYLPSQFNGHPGLLSCYRFERLTPTGLNGRDYLGGYKGLPTNGKVVFAESLYHEQMKILHDR